MNVLGEIRNRFARVIGKDVADVGPLLEVIRPAQDARWGDFQANLAMPLGKQLGRPPREVANELVARLDLGDICQRVEVAGPGFINLTLDDRWLADQLNAMVGDERLGVSRAASLRTYVIDFSSPNAAKPMHVGHIRSTVIGDALARMLRLAGHTVITDNHIGDWGTQFGMIIFGYKHFRDEARYAANPVAELARLYRVVRQLMDYHEARREIGPAEEALRALDRDVARQRELAAVTAGPSDKSADAARKELRRREARLRDQRGELETLRRRVSAVEADEQLAARAAQYPDVENDVLRETAALHAGDATNRQLWQKFLPHCRDEMNRIYQRLGVRFDQELGESFYDEMLEGVVASLVDKGLTTISDGALCIFLDSFDTPMIVRKKDGAYLYSTTDLATIDYRVKTWRPDAILYVVDHRQHEHFAKLFATARRWGFTDVELVHIGFGTVMGSDGRPFKTREGDTVGLEALLDEAVARALEVVSRADDARPTPEFDEAQRREIAQVVGIGALKYADLAQNRQTDYEFSFDKMLSLTGNTAPYLQYVYARANGIFAKGEVDVAALRADTSGIELVDASERQLAVQLVQFSQAIDDALVDWRPNLVASYLYELAQAFFRFYERCPVLDAEPASLRTSRLKLCDLTARTIRMGLGALGIDVVDKM